MPRRHAAQCASALTCEMNPGAVSAGKVLFAATGKKNEVVGEEDSLTVVVRKQEAALKKLEQKHGAGYGKPIPGSATDKRSAICKYEVIYRKVVLYMDNRVNDETKTNAS